MAKVRIIWRRGGAGIALSYHMVRGVLSLIIFCAASTAFAVSELQQEIGWLEAPPLQKKAAPKRTRQFEYADDDDRQPADLNTRVYFKQSSLEEEDWSDRFIYRFTLRGFYSLSTFDGSDKSVNEFNGGLSGELTMDLNIFGSDHWVVETGIQALRTDAKIIYSGTATPAGSYVQPSYWDYPIYSARDEISNLYLGVPINLKWMMSGEKSSSLFARAGIAPSYVVDHSYQQLRGFSAPNYFDVFVQGGLGFSLRLGQSYQIEIMGSGFQGVLPVSPDFSIYNAGFFFGTGISYVL